MRRSKQPSSSKKHPTSPTGILAKLKREKNDLRRRLMFMGYLTSMLEREGVETYIVGGEAIEVYTGGQFTTGDIDIVVSNHAKAEKLLSEMGFEQPGRVWINEQLNIGVDIVGTMLSGSRERTRAFKVGETHVKVAAAEDLIVERLASAKFWRSRYQPDLEQATILLANFRDTLDWEYLQQKVREQNVGDLYQAISAKAKEIERKQ